jgi:ketosteroid isomerase-like protein
MAQENVEIVRGALEAYARGDLERALADTDADVVWNPAEEPPMRGLDEVRAYLQRWEGVWEELDTTPEEFTDAGDRVVVTIHFRGRGRGSGVEVDARSHHVYTLRDGRTVRMDEFTDRADALKAAGLPE